MIIRKPLLSDAAAILEIEKKSFSPWSLAAVQEELSRIQGVQLLAEAKGDGGVIGWCCAMVVSGEAELLKIGVTGACRRKGIATALLLQLEQECRKRKVHELYLEVRSRNTSARALYLKHGFSEISIRPNYYRNPKDDAVMYGKNIAV